MGRRFHARPDFYAHYLVHRLTESPRHPRRTTSPSLDRVHILYKWLRLGPPCLHPCIRLVASWQTKSKP